MSSRAAASRLNKELIEYNRAPNPSLSHLGPISDDNLLHWTATLLGPRDSPYEGCSWEIDIQIPDEYPRVPPVMMFKTPVCHPNVHPKVCACEKKLVAWLLMMDG